ncbi:ABC transporter ATP-binding protein [Streptomyces sp. BI20]|uniref:ABC transporter ATP-binding protein n=1 Tax=Streptomyces sp. BI20 TaxID=3403460 RepID=UPI003C7509F4
MSAGAPAGAPPVLAARGVGVSFGGVRALTGVDVEVRAGEVCGLIGPNGAGKTTLFDVLSGIRRPDRGRLELDGRDVTRRSPVWRARHGVRRTFQRQQLFGQLSVADHLLVAQDWRGRGGLGGAGRRERARRRERVGQVLELCGIADLAGAPAAGLPLGRARLVELARAVADRPRALLLDEPASGMSAPERDRLGGVIGRLAREEGCAVLLVEHHVSFVMERCARVVVLDLGTVLAEGDPATVRADPLVREAYLGGG